MRLTNAEILFMIENETDHGHKRFQYPRTVGKFLTANAIIAFLVAISMGDCYRYMQRTQIKFRYVSLKKYSDDLGASTERFGLST